MFKYARPSAIGLVCGVALIAQPVLNTNAQAAERIGVRKPANGAIVRLNTHDKAARSASKRLQQRRGERRSASGNGWAITRPEGKKTRIWGD